MLTTNDKGLIAELEIELAAVRHGIPVYRPPEHARCDLAFDVGGRLLRVQCKCGRLSAGGDVVIVRTARHRLSTNGYLVDTYSEDEVDLFGVYAGEVDRCFLIPAARAVHKRMLHVRLAPPRNNQSACITLGDDYEFSGAIAQLGERSAGSRKVAGSNPASSTAPPDPITVGSNPFRDRLGYWMERAAGGDEVVVTHRGRPRVRLSPATGEEPGGSRP